MSNKNIHTKEIQNKKKTTGTVKRMEREVKLILRGYKSGLL